MNEEEDTAMSFNDVYGSDDDDDEDDDEEEENSRGTNNSAATVTAKNKKPDKKMNKGGALDKAWDDIIPMAMREQMEEEDRQQVTVLRNNRFSE